MVCKTNIKEHINKNIAACFYLPFKQSLFKNKIIMNFHNI